MRHPRLALALLLLPLPVLAAQVAEPDVGTLVLALLQGLALGQPGSLLLVGAAVALALKGLLLMGERLPKVGPLFAKRGVKTALAFLAPVAGYLVVALQGGVGLGFNVVAQAILLAAVSSGLFSLSKNQLQVILDALQAPVPLPRPVLQPFEGKVAAAIVEKLPPTE